MPWIEGSAQYFTDKLIRAAVKYVKLRKMYLCVTHNARAHNDPGLEKVWRGRFAVKIHLDAFCDVNCRDQNMLANVRITIISSC